VDKGAQRRVHVSVNEDCGSAAGMLHVLTLQFALTLVGWCSRNHVPILLVRVRQLAQPVGWVERSETHHLLLCYASAVTNYRRNFICGGSFFFMATLAERRCRRFQPPLAPSA
jgi:hypothetical protein